MALSVIGARSTIESFTEDSSEAQQVDTWYNYSRVQSLEAFNWNFARKRVAMALHDEDAPDVEWLFRYQYPADCVAAREIQNPLGTTANAIPFQIEADATGESKSILTNTEDAVLIYTWDLTSTVLFSAFFIEALVHVLAYHIAFPLTGSRKIKEDMLGVYNTLLRQAPAHNANEGVEVLPREAEWIRGR